MELSPEFHYTLLHTVDSENKLLINISQYCKDCEYVYFQ